MNKQPEALRLADWIEEDMSCQGDAEIADELRRQHALLEEMGVALRYYREEFTGSEPSVSVLDRKADAALAKWEESK